jgi:hypothetical protein
MGLWFFLTVVVVGNMLLKAYKMRIHNRDYRTSHDRDRVNALELELKAVREKIQHLDEAVFFGDFDLKRKFSQLEHEMAAQNKPGA